jgi:hypothetical protein
MSDDFGAALREYTASKAELEDILKSDPDNVELTQVSGIKRMLDLYFNKANTSTTRSAHVSTRSYTIWILQSETLRKH